MSRAITIFIAALVLAACDSRGTGPSQSSAPEPLASRWETLERQSSGCGEGGDCASVSIRWEVFEGRPGLNRAVHEQLLRQLQNDGEGRVPGGLASVAEDFLDEAARVPGDIATAAWQLTGEARQLTRHGDLLTLEINSYHFSGGAHGLPVTHWINWDLAADKPVSLEGVLQPGREAAFWTLARAAHQRWLEEAEADQDFRDNWPFQKTADFRFDDRGLVLLYGVYMLAPYSSGSVELTVPWDGLLGVIRERHLPN